MMWMILLASITAATIFLERAYQLHRAQIRPEDFLKGIFNIVRRGNIIEAVAICEDTAGPVARIVRAALLHHDEDRETIRQAVIEAGKAEIPRLERRLYSLAVIARLTPMLGLLGTAIGLIEGLMVLQQKAPLIHAGDLSASLWQALLTTAAGLAVAIPCYACYNFLVTRVESILLDMEQAAGEVLTQLARRPAPERKA